PELELRHCVALGSLCLQHLQVFRGNVDRWGAYRMHRGENECDEENYDEKGAHSILSPRCFRPSRIRGIVRTDGWTLNEEDQTWSLNDQIDLFLALMTSTPLLKNQVG